MQAPGSAESATLNLLRGLAAQAVLVGHYHALLMGPGSGAPVSQATAGLWQVTERLSLYSHDAVMVFFVLSGFLVGGQVIRDVASGRFLHADYVLRRFCRLYCVIVPGLLLTWLCVQLAFRWGHGAALIAANQPWFPPWFDSLHSNSVATLACNLAGLQMIGCWQYGHNLSLWSLSNEWIYYLLFPSAALLVTGRAGRAWPFHLAVVAGLAALMAAGNTPHDPDRWIIYFNGLAIWCAGAGLSAAMPAWLRCKGIVRIAVVAMLAIASAMLYSAPVPLPVRDWSVAGLTGAAMLAGAGSRPAWAWVARAAKWLASYSYSLYFIHLPLWMAAAAWWTWPTIKVARDGAGLAAFWAACLAVNIAAWGFWYLFESRHRVLDAWLRRLAAPRRR